jgi:hypothetical protein
MYKVQVELKNYNRRIGDKTVTFRTDSLFEIPSDDVSLIDAHIGDVGLLILTDVQIGNEVDFDINELVKDLEPDRELAHKKSPSKRFRDILWRLQEQELGRKPSEEEFARFYKAEYEKICSHYLEKFDKELI